MWQQVEQVNRASTRWRASRSWCCVVLCPILWGSLASIPCLVLSFVPGAPKCNRAPMRAVKCIAASSSPYTGVFQQRRGIFAQHGWQGDRPIWLSEILVIGDMIITPPKLNAVGWVLQRRRGSFSSTAGKGIDW